MRPWRQVDTLALVLALGCSVAPFAARAPARADSMACVRDALPELGYRILGEDPSEPSIEAMHMEGYTSSLGRHSDVLVARLTTKDGAKQLEVVVNGRRRLVPVAAHGAAPPGGEQSYGTPTYAAKVDADSIVQRCGARSPEGERR